LTVRRFSISLSFAATFGVTVAVMAAMTTGAAAQGAFPAPLPNQSGGAASPFPPVNGAGASPSNAAASPFPPVNSAAAPPSAFPSQGAAPLGGGLGGGAFGGGGAPGGGGGASEQEQCMKQFGPLREEAQRRANLIKAASERKAPAQEACKLINNFVQAEAKLVAFVTSKQSLCHIPADIPKQMKTGHARTLELRKNVCAAATAQQQGGPAAPPSLSEVLSSSGGVETRAATRSGGSTFDTINGNVLAR